MSFNKVILVGKVGRDPTTKKHLRLVESDDAETLIPLRTAAEMLGLDISTIRKRAAGTANLTLVPQGRKLFLVRSEIIAHRTKLIDDARRRNDVLRLVHRGDD